MVQLPWNIQDFITLFLSIIIESLPFVVLGVLVSVIVALFISEDFIIKILPKNRFLSHILVSLIGIFVPVCQCGNIPVARRLMIQGMTVSQAITFLLAAPILNPITAITTAQAFSLHPSVVIIRLTVAFLLANSIGIILSYKKDQSTYITKEFTALCNVDDRHKRSVGYGLDIFQSEFLLIMKMLCLGALIAAATQEFVPKSLLLSIGQNGFLSIIALLTVGFIISICSTVDAFFALSYINNFTLGSLVAFLLFAPLVDIKMIVLLRSTFTTALIIKISLIIFIVSVGMGILVNLLPN